MQGNGRPCVFFLRDVVVRFCLLDPGHCKMTALCPMPTIKACFTQILLGGVLVSMKPAGFLSISGRLGIIGDVMWFLLRFIHSVGSTIARLKLVSVTCQNNRIQKKRSHNNFCVCIFHYLKKKATRKQFFLNVDQTYCTILTHHIAFHDY